MQKKISRQGVAQTNCEEYRRYMPWGGLQGNVLAGAVGTVEPIGGVSEPKNIHMSKCIKTNAPKRCGRGAPPQGEKTYKFACETKKTR